MGQAHELRELTLLGAAPECDIRIEAANVAPFHARVVAIEQEYRIEALAEGLDVFVNGAEVQGHVLRDRDEVRVGQWAAVFSVAAAEADTTQKPLHEEQLITARIGVETGALEKAELADDAPQLRRQLHTVHEISSAITSIRDLNELLATICGLLFDLFESGSYVAVLTKEDGQFATVADRARSEKASKSVSRTVLRHVDEHREAVLSTNTASDKRVQYSHSVKSMRIMSIMCAPLVRAKEVVGAIYLDSRRAAGAFADSDLELLTVIARQAAIAIENARLWTDLRLARARLETENQELRKRLSAEPSSPEIIGESAPIRNLRQQIEQVADTDSTVLITGESGTGKELVARALHFEGKRRDLPFVPIDCASLPESLLESELFGVEEGVATQVTGRIGRIEQAKDGTVFLDEIGDMSPSIQAAVLRLLQERVYYRVGGRYPLTTRARFIAATNKNLIEEIQNRRFRLDLFYRLNVISIEVPPLRERITDVPLLANHFLMRFCAKLQKDIPGFTQEALSLLLSRPWPGNVRELENVVECAVTLTPNNMMIDAPALDRDGSCGEMDLPFTFVNAGSLAEATSRLEQAMIRRALCQTNGNRSQAAKLLGVSRQGLFDKLKRYSIDPKAFKQDAR